MEEKNLSCIDCHVTNCNLQDKTYPDFCLTTNMPEEVLEEGSEELPGECSEEEVETLPAKDYEPYLTDILNEIKDSDSSKEVSEMYQAVTSVTDNNVLTGTLNEQSATNVILLAIFTVLLVDTAIHFIKGVL